MQLGEDSKSDFSGETNYNIIRSFNMTLYVILSDTSVIIIATIGVVASFSLVLNVLLIIALIKKCGKSPGKWAITKFCILLYVYVA